MTASTLSSLPLLAGTAIASGLGRAGMWTLSRYMRAPLASTGLLVMVTMTAMAATNALYSQPGRHPAPFFAPSADVPVPVAAPKVAPVPATPMTVHTAAPAVADDTTGSVAAPAAPQVIPDAPVGNKDAFAVQKKLAELGLFDGTVDGFYGPMTARAIRAFEERNGLVPTGALTPGIIDAILRADADGRIPVAAAAPLPAVQTQPVVPAVVQQPVQQVAIIAPQPAPAPIPAPAQQLTPIDNAVDTVGNAAAQTIDSIVAAVSGTPAPSALLPMLPATAAQPMPAPVQVASFGATPPEPVAMAEAAPVTEQVVAVVATAAAPDPVNPANNIQLVSDIQRGLASLGFYHGSIDGHPGDATARAIREFENFHSYKVTGQVNPDLIGLLRGAGAAI